MLEALALNTLIERCAPPEAHAPLTAVIREASGGEPLVLVTVQNGRRLPVQASSLTEAVALATEMKLAGGPVRIGLAGLDTRDLDRLGVSLAQAFEPCGSIEAAAKLQAEGPARLRPTRGDLPSARSASRTVPGEAVASVEAIAAPPEAPPVGRRPWDVYGQTQGSSVLVYGR